MLLPTEGSLKSEKHICINIMLKIFFFSEGSKFQKRYLSRVDSTSIYEWDDVIKQLFLLLITIYNNSCISVLTWIHCKINLENQMILSLTFSILNLVAIIQNF
jgi:hypothetical protein